MKTVLKKTLAALMVLMVAALFFSCGGSEESSSAPESESSQQAAPQGASVEDAVDAYFANMPDHIYKIGQADFVEMVKAGEPMTVIDIRQPDVYEAGHIEGAVNLPWGSDALVDQLASIPQDGNVFVYCYTGQTAGQTVALMNLVGIPARSVNLGWNLGISNVEGVDAVTETTANSLPSATYDLDPNLYGAYQAYFEDMATKAGTNFANNIVSEANAKAILDAADPDVEFVSIRRAEHYAEGHIPTATNMPWGKGMQTMFDSLPADKKLIVYCYSGQTAGQTVAMLRVLGYDAVSLRGGMGVGANAPQGWANQGYETVASN